ncbi:cellulase family glycosylhydrolase [Parachitinimonas caeni]|uniref:Cellulase family glycosylhydrolase n=1 Tax=Parachitinimonas caeni TaxID=3031301 RepID=A0ABT7DV21_9NEIS|nr:cellulase family glycosylhydrolase [Parachitinimonas caeni]MDK2123921.1 cellulase family glycosylhydrolase [Parachitinimonas caeni]
MSIAAISIALALAPQVNHTLDFDRDPRAIPLTVVDKAYNNGGINVTDKVLQDGLGRETVLRGWNISGSAKLKESGFKPFRHVNDAKASLAAMRLRSGSNVIRFLMSWEGVNPTFLKTDTTYLNDVTEQIRAAIDQKMYVLLDWHQDLQSRHLFNANSWHTGNGAPAWVIKGGGYPAEYCGIVCAHWGQHNLTDEAVRRAARNFWNNALILSQNPIGFIPTQEAYLWQMGEALKHIRSKLTDAEFGYILGVDPLNEPIDGGMEGLTPARWDNEKLWPFYRKVRARMNDIGWQSKPVYAEPLVFWNTNAGIVAPATGGHHLTDKPASGFVFNSHFYDAGRQGVDVRPVNNGSYLTHMHQIRDEARWMGMPAFVSEFGMFNRGTGPKDTNRTIAAMYQGLETSDAFRSTKDRMADAYSPPLSGTQWHWDWYYNQHNEAQNDNPSKIQQKTDGWNNEDFSAILTFVGYVMYNIDGRNIERVYPRKAQGSIMAFHYNAIARSAWNEPLNWLALRPAIGGREYFRNQRWGLLVWRGRKSEAPTELFLPTEFGSGAAAAITEKWVVENLTTSNQPSNLRNEVMLTNDNSGGSRLLVWDDADSDETADSWHYVLVVKKEGGEVMDTTVLSRLQSELNETFRRQQSPVYLTGDMTNGGYVADKPPR